MSGDIEPDIFGDEDTAEDLAADAAFAAQLDAEDLAEEQAELAEEWDFRDRQEFADRLLAEGLPAPDWLIYTPDELDTFAALK